jgi:hypothetical protein
MYSLLFGCVTDMTARWWCIVSDLKGVMLTYASNQSKAEEYSMKTKEVTRPRWWCSAWQEPFFITLVTWGTQREEGPWSSEQKSIGSAHVCCVSIPLTPPFTAPLYHLCRRGFLLLCVFFICVCVCVCTLFVWQDKDREGKGRGGRWVCWTRHCCSVWNKGRLASVCVVLRPCAGHRPTYTMRWGKVLLYIIVLKLSPFYAAVLETHVLRHPPLHLR